MTRLHTILGALAIGGAAVYAACSKSTPEPEKSSEAPPSVTPPAHTLPPSHPNIAPGSAPAPSAGPDDIGWEAPKAWQSVANANTMRKATYKIPRAAGDSEDAELTVSAAAGGVDANIKRWAGQFGNAEPKTEPRTPNGLKVTVVELKGTFSGGGGMMGGPAVPKEKYMLLGAVVDGGDRQHFFKMTGPEKTVSAAKKDFDAFVASFRAK
ncbi:MAG TPA: hypothetical protein VM925_10705 [Labilithrix sp.]|nr:hypothetical protein [Labilithrix sp.]